MLTRLAVYASVALRSRRRHDPLPHDAPRPSPQAAPVPRVRAGAVLLSCVLGLGCLGAAAAAGAAAGQATATRPTTVASTGSPTLDPELLWGTFSGSVARIGGTGALGSGFLIGPETLLTAAHTLASSQAIRTDLATGSDPTLQIVFTDGFTTTAKVSTIDSATDFAVLDLADGPPGARIPAWAPDLSPIGSGVVAVGHVDGIGAQMTTGTVTGHPTSADWTPSGRPDATLTVDAAVNPGMSGGPLLDASGRVAGMIVSRPDTVSGRPAAGVAAATPSPVLRGALNRSDASILTGPARLGVTASDTPDGIQVTGRSAGGYSSPLNPGDIITAVGSQPTATTADLYAALDQVTSDTVPLTVTRSGARINVQTPAVRDGGVTTS